MRLSCISEALHQQKLNSVTITLLGISPFSPFSLFFLVFKNNLVIRISSTPISTRFYFLLDRGILTVRLIDRLRNSITKKNGRRIFFWEIFTEIIKSLIKILAPPTFFFSTFKHSHTRDSTKLSHLYSHGIPSRKFHPGWNSIYSAAKNTKDRQTDTNKTSLKSRSSHRWIEKRPQRRA